LSAIPRLSKGSALFFLIIAAGFIVLFNAGSASAQVCAIGIIKEAEGAGDTVFNFITEEGGHQGQFSLRDGEATGGQFDPSGITIVELPTPGWHLDNVVCDTEGLTITDIPGGVLVECTGPNGGTGNCTFINLPGTASNIPTLSEWGMIAAAVGLGLVGVFFAIRKRLQASNEFDV
jgi:hypothetical protein